MHRPKQERISLRLKMVERDLSMKSLAALIGRPRETVSKAVNHGRFPRVLAQVKEALNA